MHCTAVSCERLYFDHFIIQLFLSSYSESDYQIPISNPVLTVTCCKKLLIFLPLPVPTTKVCHLQCPTEFLTNITLLTFQAIEEYLEQICVDHNSTICSGDAPIKDPALKVSSMLGILTLVDSFVSEKKGNFLTTLLPKLIQETARSIHQTGSHIVSALSDIRLLFPESTK